MPGSYGSLVKVAERLTVAPEVATPAVINTPAALWQAESHAVPTMQSLGLVRQDTPFPGGETEGLARLRRSRGIDASQLAARDASDADTSRKDPGSPHSKSPRQTLPSLTRMMWPQLSWARA
jgi:hypothetical protein